ncbi:MAG: ABC transporter permease [Arachnia sp.]
MLGPFIIVELKRLVRDPVTVFFVALLPVFLFLAYAWGVSLPTGALGIDDVDAYVMVGMAGYGAATAAANVSGHAAVERLQGWGRQLSLTPLTDGGFVAIKAIVAMVVSLVPILGTFLVGWLSGISLAPSAWLVSGAVLLGGSSMWAAYGLLPGLAFRSEGAVAAATGGLVVLAFLGNVFVPLGGAALAFARWTPLYGYVALARHPITSGQSMITGDAAHESWWIPAASVAAWSLVFAASAWRLVARSRSRA